MNRKKWLLVLAVTLLAVAGLIWAFTPAALEVELATAQRGPFVLAIEDDGVTRVRDRYWVTAPVAGVLLRPTLRAGDRVTRDATIAVIVPTPAQMLDVRTRTELAARVEAAAARVDRAGATARQAEAALLQAQNDHKRIEQLAASGYASTTERERAALTLDLRRKDVEATLFERDAAKHELEQARAAARESNASSAANRRTIWPVRAPVDGQVLRVLQDSEGPIAVGGPIMEIGNTAQLEATVDVLSTEATEIAPNAFVSLAAGAGLTLSGRVRHVEPAATTKVSALGVEEQRVNVVIDLLPNPQALDRIGDGFRVNAKIETTRVDDAITVPTAALFRDGERWAVFKAAHSRTALTHVGVGARGGGSAVVTKGLAAGDQVVVYPSDSVQDGSKVRARAAQRE
jgi:HlyD family secretion protein